MWWRLLLIFALAAGASTAVRAGDLGWSSCRASTGVGPPVLGACCSLTGPIDPQGRELWLRSTASPTRDARPRALYIVATASSEAWLNGRRLGGNGRPAGSAAAERPGRYQVAYLIPDQLWTGRSDELVVHLSSFHGGLRLDYPVAGVWIGPYPHVEPLPALAVTWATAGALLAAAFGFGVVHWLRRTPSSLMLAALSGIAALQAGVESLRVLAPYPYPLHAPRLMAIWLLAASFAVQLAAFTAARFVVRGRRRLTVAAGAAVGATGLLPGFDGKTGWALMIGVAFALVAAAAGVRAGRQGAWPMAAYLLLFLVLGVAAPERLADLSYFLLAAGLVLPLLVVEVVRLGRDDRRREAALTQAASLPNHLTVASAGGIERIALADITSVLGADDYAELRLVGGRTLLHPARLSQLERELAPDFLRIHRSSIVNLTQVERLVRDGDRWRLALRDGRSLGVSRSRLPALRSALTGEVTSNSD